MSQKSIYVISTEADSKINKYKIGNHTGSQKKLLSRYQTYLINPIIFYYRPVHNWTIIDSEIKSKLHDYRIQTNDGTVTEWFQLQLSDIIFHIEEIIGIHDIHECDIDSDFDSDPDSNNKIFVNNFNDFMKYCKFITKIVITNKQNCEGYIKLNNWRKIWGFDLNKIMNNIDDDEYYTIFNFDNGTETLIGYLFTNKKDYHSNSRIVYFWKNIINSIIKKCYSKHPQFYNLSYHEYQIYGNKPVILNANNFTLKDIPSDRIILEGGSNVCIAMKDFDIQFINNIINAYVNDKLFITQFKQLCKNIIVKESNKITVFHDFRSNHDYSLSNWLRWAIHKLGLIDSIDYINDADYYSNQTEFNKQFKKILPRCVFITPSKFFIKDNLRINKKSTDKIINDFKNIGIKNIIVQSNGIDHYYSSNHFETYIQDNFIGLLTLIVDPDKHEQFIKCVSDKFDIFDLIEGSKLFFDNMLKWSLS